MSDPVYVALVGFLSAIGGGVIQAWAHRNFDAQKVERQNRTDAYLSYLKGISELSFAQNEADKAGANSRIADARGRIALSGSPAVIATMVESFDLGADLHSSKARVTHAQVIAAMRADSLAQPGKSKPDNLFIMLYGRGKRTNSDLFSAAAPSGSDLPDWYPLANATDQEIAAWLTADKPPYNEMRAALPWLSNEHQLEAWLDRLRKVEGTDASLLGNLIPIPLPPRRAGGRCK